MKQESFERIHQKEWQAFEHWLLIKTRRKHLSSEESLHFKLTDEQAPTQYRQLCQQLAVARDRGYSLVLIERLHSLVSDGHDIIYSTGSSPGKKAFNYLSGGFARDVRREWLWVSVSALLLIVPWILTQIATMYWPNFVYVILPPQTVDMFDRMYTDMRDPRGDTLAGADKNLIMFGFYIYNNIGIAFKAFASGLLAGIGSCVILIFNGIYMGAIEGRLISIGLGRNFYSFVSGHSAFELTGIILSGAAGLKMGWGMISPKNLSRKDALFTNARSVIGIVMGSCFLLVLAAMIEAFWSPHNFALWIKVSTGVFFLLLLLGYFIFTGRRHES